MKDDLLTAIENKTAKVVVLGLGYVGLPVACMFAEAGFTVAGLEHCQEKVEVINQGICPIDGKEPGLAELLTHTISQNRFCATTDYETCRDAHIVLVAVETPVDPMTKKPDYRVLRDALTDLGHNLSRDTMVIIESTIAPGTMDGVVRSILEETSGLQVSDQLKSGDFYLVNCPERVMPGKLLANIRGCHRVIGAMSSTAAELAVQFYRSIVQANLDPVDCLTAELVKTMENAYRDVQIAFANEMALLCENMGADVWQVRELVNKSPYRDMHLPGAGVGGHCISKDPWLLVANTNNGFNPRLIPAARMINDGMPPHTVSLTVEALQKADVETQDAKVAVLGYAYLANSDDTRNSPSAVLVTQLRELGAKVIVHDPYVFEYRGDLREVVQDCDAVVLMVAHDVYRAIDLNELRAQVARPILIDGRHVFSAESAQAAGWDYYGVGVGQESR